MRYFVIYCLKNFNGSLKDRTTRIGASTKWKQLWFKRWSTYLLYTAIERGHHYLFEGHSVVRLCEFTQHRTADSIGIWRVTNTVMWVRLWAVHRWQGGVTLGGPSWALIASNTACGGLTDSGCWLAVVLCCSSYRKDCLLSEILFFFLLS